MARNPGGRPERAGPLGRVMEAIRRGIGALGDRHPSWRSPRFCAGAALTLAFAVANGAAAVAGLGYDDSALSGRLAGDLFQLLDTRLLQDQLVTSVWHLESQPPLFNLSAGLLLQLPAGAVGPTAAVGAVLLGLALTLASYLLAVELGVPPWPAAAAVAVFIVASPSFLIFQHWFDYAYPTATFMVLGCWCLIRYLRTDRPAFGAGFAVALCAVVLLDTTYQVIWLVPALLVVLVMRRTSWRRLAACAAVPLLVVVAWYAKNAIMFGSYSTSTWLGMNLARSTLVAAGPAERAKLEAHQVVTPLASVQPFSSPSDYVPRFVPAPARTKVAALDERRKANGAPNFNNPLYAEVSSKYLHDDLAYIVHDPAAYLSHVVRGVALWVTPPDQYFFGAALRRPIAGYADFYDRYVAWQPNVNPYPALYLFSDAVPPASELSWLAVLTLLGALVGGPVLAWRRRRSDVAMAVTVTVMWWTILYAFVVTSLVEVGENERFAFEMGPLPLLVSLALLSAGWRALRDRR